MVISSNRVVTYSPAYTLVPTYECFNRCTYCNFRVDPGQDDWMTVEAATQILHSCSSSSVIEILILSGEVHPQSARRGAWFQRIAAICERALSLGFLPHTNAGPLSFDEMSRLKQINVSMGLMLEQMTPDLLNTVHQYAPSKVPDHRLQQLKWAGELQIPFTTGLLLGIGETDADWDDTLAAIAHVHSQYGHIQEVILQPHSPGTHQNQIGEPFPLERLVEGVAIARRLLPEDIRLQIPPNLVSNPSLLLACLEAGARDLGGISPKDEVNPDYPHPHVEALIDILEPAGWTLQPRLPVYPQYDDWLPPDLRKAVFEWRSRLYCPQV
ncbi:MAG: 7,8-didemethyl-8-hydroxy-5-deazariboflavin synthase subunit CofG [Elainellaceae cyanobacterium]